MMWRLASSACSRDAVGCIWQQLAQDRRRHLEHQYHFSGQVAWNELRDFGADATRPTSAAMR